MSAESRKAPSRAVLMWRIAWTAVSLVVVQAIVCGLSAAPAILIVAWILAITDSSAALRWTLLSLVVAPSYLMFAVCLMIVSSVAMRLLGWRTPPHAEMHIADMSWDLLRWVRYGASIHVVRVAAGTLVRGSPLWTMYLRFCGARLGRRVYFNTLAVTDYNLIECGNDCIVGGGVNMSGHTVERGVVKTARVRLGDNVTIGVGSVIEIGVEIGSGVQVGALSFVPKFEKLKAGRVYAGAPAIPIE
jgi:acetyltransferase-like isoleucine patch superfamily enzyme